MKTEQNPYQPPQATVGRSVDQVTVTAAAGSRVVVTISTVTAVAFATGVISRIARDHIPGSVHYEMLVALFVLVGLCLFALSRFRSNPAGIFYLNLAIFGIWTGFATAWLLIHRRFWDDFVSVIFVCWIGSAVTGTILLKLYQVYQGRSSDSA